MKKKIQCKVCGAKFYPKNSYEVYESQRIFSAISANTYDATDCPNCGSQRLLGVRNPKVEPKELKEERGNENESNA